MAPSFPTQKSDSLKDNDHVETYQNYTELVSTLPREKEWVNLYLYEGFWYPTNSLPRTITLQKHFKARPTDVFLVTNPKSGTTWFKALLFAIANRNIYDFHTHPLLTKTPHECVPFLDMYANEHSTSNPDHPPLLSTHISYTSLPKSILDSGCRVVYVFRDPKDIFVSLWHFVNNNKPKEQQLQYTIEEVFEQFCRGVSPHGPFWDHVLGYWRASVECPDRVLLIKYEDMKSDPFVIAKRLAAFSGHTFSSEEESEGVVSKIVDLCSFENMSNLEVNKTGSYNEGAPDMIQNSTFFRKGKVGDSKNYLTTEMINRIDQITKEKFKDFFDITGALNA